MTMMFKCTRLMLTLFLSSCVSHPRRNASQVIAQWGLPSNHKPLITIECLDYYLENEQIIAADDRYSEKDDTSLSSVQRGILLPLAKSKLRFAMREIIFHAGTIAAETQTVEVVLCNGTRLEVKRMIHVETKPKFLSTHAMLQTMLKKLNRAITADQQLQEKVKIMSGF